MKYFSVYILTLAVCWTEIVGQSRVVDKNLTPEQFASFAHGNTSFKWIKSVTKWYIPMLSLTAAEQFREILIGDKAPLTNETHPNYDWSNFCFRTEFHDPATFYEGFDEIQVAKCKVTRTPIVYGTCNYMSDRTDRIHKAYVMTAETDNDNYLLVIRKWIDPEGIETDWWLNSPQKSISQGVQDLVIQHLKDFGFSTSNIVHVNYDQCKN